MQIFILCHYWNMTYFMKSCVCVYFLCFRRPTVTFYWCDYIFMWLDLQKWSSTHAQFSEHNLIIKRHTMLKPFVMLMLPADQFQVISFYKVVMCGEDPFSQILSHNFYVHIFSTTETTILQSWDFVVTR